jgi:16S rRNA processing protein RimM
MEQNYSFPTGDFLLLGKVAKAHGMRGEVKIFPYSGQPENMKAYKELVLVNDRGTLSRPLTVLSCKVQGKMAITRLDSVSSRDEAESVEGLKVLIARKFLPELSEDEFYWHQYVGKTVTDINQHDIGKIESIFSNGRQDIMVIRAGSKEILVPISKAIVVGESAEKLTIDPPPGLLELYTDSDCERDDYIPG